MLPYLKKVILQASILIFILPALAIADESDLGANKLLSIQTEYIWDKTISEWVLEDCNRYKYKYNENNQLSELIWEWFFSRNIPTPWEKYEYIYNEKGLLIDEIFYSWSTDEDDWLKDNNTITTFKYNANNLLTEKFVIIINNGLDSTKYKTIYSYDDNYNLIEVIKTQTIDGVWRNTYRYLYDYDEFNRLIKKYIFAQYPLDEWLYRWQFDYIYNSMDSLQEEITYVREADSWVFSSKDIYSYNDSRLLQSRETYMLDDDSVLYLDKKKEYDYDENGMNATEIQTNLKNGRMENKYKIVYEYIKPNAVKKQSFDNDVFVAYPNPVENNINVNLRLQKASDISIEIVNTLGESAISFLDTHLPEGRRFFNINCISLPPGLYFIAIRIDNEICHRGFIKK